MHALYETDNGDISLCISSQELTKGQIRCSIVSLTSNKPLISDFALTIFRTTMQTEFRELNCDWKKVKNTDQEAPVEIAINPALVKELKNHHERTTSVRMGAIGNVVFYLDNEEMNRIFEYHLLNAQGA